MCIDPSSGCHISPQARNGSISHLFSFKLVLEQLRKKTKITTKYTIQRPRKSRKRSPSVEPGATTDDSTSTKKPTTSAQTSAPTSTQPMGDLVLKTYDPVSGTCLKYRTDKAAEVGRLVTSLGRLGREFCGLREEESDGPMNTAPESTAGPKDQLEAIPAKTNVAPTVEASDAGMIGQKRDALATKTKGEAKGGGTGKKRRKGKK